jgi:hypothetical protein
MGTRYGRSAALNFRPIRVAQVCADAMRNPLRVLKRGTVVRLFSRLTGRPGIQTEFAILIHRPRTGSSYSMVSNCEHPGILYLCRSPETDETDPRLFSGCIHAIPRTGMDGIEFSLLTVDTALPTSVIYYNLPDSWYDPRGGRMVKRTLIVARTDHLLQIGRERHPVFHRFVLV